MKKVSMLLSVLLLGSLQEMSLAKGSLGEPLELDSGEKGFFNNPAISKKKKGVVGGMVFIGSMPAIAFLTGALTSPFTVPFGAACLWNRILLIKDQKTSKTAGRASVTLGVVSCLCMNRAFYYGGLRGSTSQHDSLAEGSAKDASNCYAYCSLFSVMSAGFLAGTSYTTQQSPWLGNFKAAAKSALRKVKP